MRWTLLLTALLSCKSSEDSATTGGATARYDAPASGVIPWKAIPFPNDLFLGADGTLELNTLPRDAHDEPVWQATLGLLDKRKGFCASCSVYFPIDGELTGIPTSIDTPTANDPIVFVDLEDKKLVPIRAFWSSEDHFVAVRPPPGVILLKKHKYAVALTTALKAKDGQPLRASTGMNTNRVTSILNPAFTALGALGIAREKIASLTTFSVDDVTADVTAARALAWAAPKPVAVIDKVWTADKLDELMGVPEEKLVGRRKAIDGHYGASHDQIAMVLTGRFKSPRVITGKTPDIGAPLRDDAGALKAGAHEDVNFLVTIPKGVDLASAAVVLVHTGLTGTMSNGLILGDTIARAGAIGFPGVGTYDGAPVPPINYPVSANFTLGGQKITAASARFEGAMHIMSAYAEEESSWETMVPPYKARTPKTVIKNPVVAVQKQLELFYGSRFKTGRAQIAVE